MSNSGYDCDGGSGVVRSEWREPIWECSDEAADGREAPAGQRIVSPHFNRAADLARARVGRPLTTGPFAVQRLILEAHVYSGPATGSRGRK